MAYFILQHAVDTPETGPEFPQVQKMTPGYDFSSSRSVHTLSSCHDRMPDFTPDLNAFVLHSRAKPTDLLSVTPARRGLLTSPSLRSILEKMILPEHCFYKATVKYRSKDLPYFWMHWICDLTRHIDYPRSTFSTFRMYSKKTGDIELTSFEDLVEKQESLRSKMPNDFPSIEADHIHFLPELAPDFGMFKIGLVDTRIYVSEKLKVRLEQERVSGIIITEAMNLSPG